MRKVLQTLYKIKILRRIIPSLLKIFLKFFKTNETIVKNNEVLLNLNLLNPIDREIYLKDEYEKEQIDFLTKQIKENKINFFLDIGAHMGIYSIIMSKKIYLYTHLSL